MKLIHQLNLSFGVLLLSIVVVTAVLIYPIMSDTLIKGQRASMQEQAVTFMSQIKNPGIPGKKPVNINPSEFETPQSLLANLNHTFIMRNLPKRNLSAGEQVLIRDGILHKPDGEYLLETEVEPPSLLNPNAMTVLVTTPIAQIESMQNELFIRFMVVLTIGGLLAFLLSIYMTRRIATPLMKLREELKKLETRRFSEVQLIRSGGEIGEVAQSVHQLAAELDRHQLAQKQFFQNASHELKTPLTSIRGYAEGILDGIFKENAAVKGLQTIASECERLKKIVNEMILLAKLESEEGIFHAYHVSVEQLVSQTAERINPQLLDKGLKLEVTTLSPASKASHIKADPDKMLQALLNIVDNASRYARHIIRIQIEEQDNTISIKIADDGAGIADSLLPRLFQRFAKGQDGQTGLGLAISRAIVERCQGQISASNGSNGGAAFVLRFPAAGS